MRILRRTRALVSLLVASGLAIGLLGVPGKAGADPVTFLPPVGTPISIKFIDHESLLDLFPPVGPSAGDILNGVFTATSIEPPVGGGPAYWTPSLDGSELNGLFTGLTVLATSTDPVSGIVTTAYTGGTATVYNVLLGTFAPAGGPVPALAMLCPLGACPAPWLTFSWAPQGILGGVPITQITTFNPATGTGSGLTAWLDVTGGTAFSYFDNNSFLTPLGAAADGTIASTFALCPPGSGCAPGWTFLSNDPIQSQVAPEPTTILLWGTALLGVGIVRRRFGGRRPLGG